MSIERDYFWFRLFKTRGIGRKILASVAKIVAAENLNPEMLPLNPKDLSVQFPKLAKILKEKIREEDREKVSTAYKQLKKQNIDIVYPRHPNFPPQLLDISPILFVKGQKERLRSDSVTIVGARDVSDKGVRITRNLAGELVSKGINIVSGYAEGVDVEAHLGALEAGEQQQSFCLTASNSCVKKVPLRNSIGIGMCLRFHNLTRIPRGRRGIRWREINWCAPFLRRLLLLNRDLSGMRKAR